MSKLIYNWPFTIARIHGARHVKNFWQENGSTVSVYCNCRSYGSGKKSDDGFFSRASTFLTPANNEGLHKVYSERRIMGFSMEQMFDVVIDVAGYHKFLPWCHKSVILSQSQNNMLAEMTIGIQPLTERYTSNVSFSRPLYIVAESKHGRLFNHLENNWKFSPGLKSHPNSCVVDFSVSFKFKSALQAKLGNVFFDETAKAMTAAFYTEAQRRYGKESVPSMKIQIVPKNDKP